MIINIYLSGQNFNPSKKRSKLFSEAIVIRELGAPTKYDPNKTSTFSLVKIPLKTSQFQNIDQAIFESISFLKKYKTTITRSKIESIVILMKIQSKDQVYFSFSSSDINFFRKISVEFKFDIEFVEKELIANIKRQYNKVLKTLNITSIKYLETETVGKKINRQQADALQILGTSIHGRSKNIQISQEKETGSRNIKSLHPRASIKTRKN